MGGKEVWAGPLHNWGDIGGKRRGSSGVPAGFALPCLCRWAVFGPRVFAGQQGDLFPGPLGWLGRWSGVLGPQCPAQAAPEALRKHSSGSCPAAVGSGPEARERPSLPTSLLRPYPHAWHSSLPPSGSPCLNADCIWDCLMAFIQVISTLTLIR